MASTSGRRVIVPLVNRSGGQVIAGDVVVIGDGTNDACFTTTTTASFNARHVGIAQETIASLATGRVLTSGYSSIVNSAASLTRDHFLFTSTVAKEATGSATRAAGAFGQVLTTGTDTVCLIWGVPDGAGGAGLGAWTDYTPTWGASGTAPALGNGTLTGRYKALDSKTYAISIALTLGSTSTVGTGQFSFTLPGGLTSVARVQLMSAAVLDSGTAYFSATAWVAASDTKILHIVVADATGDRRAGGGVPVTYATGDQIIISGMYEVV